jgi:hypothetical protein
VGRRPAARPLRSRRLASIATETRRDPGSRVSSPRLRAAELCSVRFMVIKPSRPSRARAKEIARGPRRSDTLGRGHRASGVTPAEYAAGPAVKTSNPASRLVARVAPLVAFGLGLKNPGRRASSFDSTPIAGVYTNQTKIIPLGSSTGAGNSRRAVSGRARLQGACRHGSLSETDTMRPHAGGIDFPALGVCGLELNGYAIEPIDDDGRLGRHAPTPPRT